MRKKLFALSLLLVFVFSLGLSLAVTEDAIARPKDCDCDLMFCLEPMGQLMRWGEWNDQLSRCTFNPNCPVFDCD
jgi:hypothetical protein